MKWTDEQQAAIDTRNCNLLVAAGAGSGKTAVLVERILKKIIEDKVDIDRLLVVTFTNAAASEMRERIANRLYQELEKDATLQKQITMLAKSNISTLHSFCLKVIRDNFFKIDLDPNFRIGDQVECELLKIETIEELMEELYEADDKEFEELINTYTGNREDSELKNIALSIYNFVQSTPKPNEWLEEKCEMYNLRDGVDFAETEWGKLLLDYAKEEVEGQIQELKNLEKDLYDYPNYLQTIQDDILVLKAISEKNNTWDSFYNQIRLLEFSKLKPCKDIDDDLKQAVKDTREKMKKSIKEYLCESVFVSNSEAILSDMKLLYKNLKALTRFIELFDKKFSEKKREKNILDFNDIEHIALKLLSENEDISGMYKEKFDEILIDEYQDSNLVQESIINTIAKNRTFMVGDVKQSIYRFRHACPALFLNKYETYSDDSEYGKKILLFKNFRSNENIIDATNYIFKQIMSKEFGEIDYTEKEYLQFGATYYPQKSEPVEVHLIETNNEDIENEDDIEDKPQLEARVIANRISELVGNVEVYDKNTGNMRKAEYRDIVILLRATTNYADIFSKELADKNIPVYADNQMGYFENSEIQIITSLLKIIDNPMQDIPLLAVMRSQIGNFTVDELTSIRLVDRNCNFYTAMQKFAAADTRIDNFDNLANKVKEFMEKLTEWRDKSNYLSLFDLLWSLYNETGYYYYVSLLPDGMKRQANLKLLLERAKSFESTSYKGLFNFLNYIDNIRESSGDLESSKLIGENENVVRIMSIHKSKGLEFPIVFLAGTTRKFNRRDFNEKIILHQKLGFGPNIIKYAKRITYPSIPKLAILQEAKREELSEEMRILYVAMTRARERLIITGMTKNIEKLCDKMNNEVTNYSVSKASCFFDWIGQAVIEKDNDWIIKRWSYDDVLKLSNIEEEKYENLKDDIKKFKPSKDYLELDKKMSWKYSHMEATSLPTKVSISEMKRKYVIDDESVNNENVLIEKPAFMEEKIDTGTSYGTRVHFILQNIDYAEPNVDKFISDLPNNVQKHIIDQINKFIASKLYDRIKNSKAFYRETSFNLNVSANEVYSFDSDIGEEVMLQGIIDLYFIENDEIVLVDFKTDNVDSGDELVKRYRIQLELYKRALEEITGMRVKESIIYSLKLGQQFDI